MKISSVFKTLDGELSHLIHPSHPTYPVAAILDEPTANSPLHECE